jgi:hypothetical protein
VNDDVMFVPQTKIFKGNYFTLKMCILTIFWNFDTKNERAISGNCCPQCPP